MGEIRSLNTDRSVVVWSQETAGGEGWTGNRDPTPGVTLPNG